MHLIARLSLTVAVSSAFAIAACGGDVVVDEGPSGNGGSGPSSSSNTVSSTVTSSSGVPSVVASSSSGGPVSSSTGPCQSCGEALSNQQIPAANVCPGQSQALYDSLVFCVCAQVCAGACSSSVCIGNGFTDECAQCIQSSCFEPFNDCANDF